MALPKLTPALADLTQDIAGPLPIELFRDWVAGTQDVDQAAALLRPFAITGTVVATDSSGLSKLTEEKDLLDVLAMVSRPKEIVHAFGSGLGGRAIGTWVADNTEMHYADAVPAASIVDAMVSAQSRIDTDASIRIGMCVHSGSFYEIAGGLYGPDADTVEYLAERFAAPGEILVTTRVGAQLGGHAPAMSRRRELDVIFPGGVDSIAPGTKPRAMMTEGAATYPHPFPTDFFDALMRLRAPGAPEGLRGELYRSLLQERVIVFISRERDVVEAANITALLDDLVTNAVMEAVVNASKVKHRIASLGGGLAILSFDDPQEAVEASLTLRDEFVEMGLPAKIGIDAGPVLLFANPRGRSGISGDAVNIASKISEDVGVVNMVSVTDRVARAVRGLDGAVPFQATISRVAIAGVRW
jgi:hypothetical protein